MSVWVVLNGLVCIHKVVLFLFKDIVDNICVLGLFFGQGVGWWTPEYSPVLPLINSCVFFCVLQAALESTACSSLVG